MPKIDFADYIGDYDTTQERLLSHIVTHLAGIEALLRWFAERAESEDKRKAEHRRATAPK